MAVRWPLRKRRAREEREARINALSGKLNADLLCGTFATYVGRIRPISAAPMFSDPGAQALLGGARTRYFVHARAPLHAKQRMARLTGTGNLLAIFAPAVCDQFLSIPSPSPFRPLTIATDRSRQGAVAAKPEYSGSLETGGRGAVAGVALMGHRPARQPCQECPRVRIGIRRQAEAFGSCIARVACRDEMPELAVGASHVRTPP